MENNQIFQDILLTSTVASLEPSQMERSRLLGELLEWCNGFLKASYNWRKESFETSWHGYQRDADGIYDPNLVAKKEGWQSKAFIPITPSHRENIQAALFRMIVGARPPLEVRARTTQPQDQSDNIRDLILRDMEKTRFEVELNKVLNDKTTFGSGFARVRYEIKTGERRVRSPIHAALEVLNPVNVIKSFMGKNPVIGFSDEVKKVVLYRGVKFEHISIWDIFPDPSSTEIQGHPIAYRFTQTLGNVVEGIKGGYFFPEALAKIWSGISKETKPEEKISVDADRSIYQAETPRPDYGKKLEFLELWADIPKKWVYVRGEEIDDPDSLVPARVIFHKDAILTVETNDSYDGEAPIYKDDYLPVNGRFYGMGVCEMLRHIQEVVNETVNQRIDNVALVLNRMFGVIEKAVVDREDFVSKPGGFIRINSKFAQDIRQALMAIDIPDITRSAYADVQEMERYAQERSSANRVTLGSSGLVNDANKTLGGMELIRQSAGEKFAYIGMLTEFSFLYDVFRAFWKEIYSNIQPEDILSSLGPDRALSFQLLTPEQIEQDYIYEPQGIFTMENKALTQSRLQMILQQFGGQPWIDAMAFFDKIVKANNLDPEALKLSQEDMAKMMQAQAMMAGIVSPDQARSVAGLGAPPVPSAPQTNGVHG